MNIVEICRLVWQSRDWKFIVLFLAYYAAVGYAVIYGIRYMAQNEQWWTNQIAAVLVGCLILGAGQVLIGIGQIFYSLIMFLVKLARRRITGPYNQ